MRYIIFRGKRVDNGEWVYGDLCTHSVDSPQIRTVSVNIPCQKLVESVTYDVNEVTVGEFAWIVDSTGKEVFEGDIIDNQSGGKLISRGVVCFKNQELCVDIIYPQFSPDKSLSYIRYEIGAYQTPWKVVGNVHDNGELLNTWLLDK